MGYRKAIVQKYERVVTEVTEEELAVDRMFNRHYDINGILREKMKEMFKKGYTAIKGKTVSVTLDNGKGSTVIITVDNTGKVVENKSSLFQ